MRVTTRRLQVPLDSGELLLRRPETVPVPSSRLSVCLRAVAAVSGVFALPLGMAQSTTDTLAPVVVTGTRTEARAFDLPMSIDAIDRSEIQDGKARVNISEVLNRAPGTFVQNRENFAQEL